MHISNRIVTMLSAGQRCVVGHRLHIASTVRKVACCLLGSSKLNLQLAAFEDVLHVIAPNLPLLHTTK